LIVGGFGMAFAMTPTTAAAMSSVSNDKAGVGSAVLNSMRQVGGSLGIAVMGAIIASYVPASQAGTARGNPKVALDFVHGFQRALIVAAAIAAFAAVVAFVTVRKPRHAEEAEVRSPAVEAA
jgi:MFS family permease